MKRPDGVEGYLAFMAGAAAGAAFMQWLAASGWTFPGFPARNGDLEARTWNATAASVRRIHSVLGEIRAIMKARKAAGKDPADPADMAGDSVPDAIETASAAAEEAAEAAGPGTEYPSGEGWMRRDRPGFARPGLRSGMPDGVVPAAAAAFAAAAWAAYGGKGSRAAWPALGGFLAAAALHVLGRTGLAGLAGPGGWSQSSIPADRRRGRSRSAAS